MRMDRRGFIGTATAAAALGAFGRRAAAAKGAPLGMARNPLESEQFCWPPVCAWLPRLSRRVTTISAFPDPAS